MANFWTCLVFFTQTLLNFADHIEFIFWRGKLSFSSCSYGLLGASGCGKTTVLSTIVGLKKIDKGVVTVFGTKPGDRKMGIPGKRVGYMPQVN